MQKHKRAKHSYYRNRPMTSMQKSYDSFHKNNYTDKSIFMKCPCHSGKNYDLCCGPYHKNQKLPETALHLMRSRYSAYALDLADYIIKSTHPNSPLFEKNRSDWIASIHEFSRTTQFQGLRIEFSDETHVTFYAILNTLGKDTSFREKSLFEKSGDLWCYVSPITSGRTKR